MAATHVGSWSSTPTPPGADPDASGAPLTSGAASPLHRFDAELDASELDDRLRPGGTWTARARAINRSSIVLASRRMCYTGRQLVVAVHLIDDAPVTLMGRVSSCEYDSDGLYQVTLDLIPLPASGPVREWMSARGR